MGRALVALMLLPQAVFGDVLTFDVWPTHDPDQEVSCRIELKDNQINVLEVLGTGMPPGRPLRWPVRKAEEVAMLRALQALISGDLPGTLAYQSRLPPPPYVTVNWSSRVNDSYVTGDYQQAGLVLPVLLAGVIDTVIPGGPCGQVIGR